MTDRPHGRGEVDDITFAPVLGLHQPDGNLGDLLSNDPWAASEIFYPLDPIPRSLWPYPDNGRAHLSLPGTLLETLADRAFQERAYCIVDCGIAAVLRAEHRNQRNYHLGDS